MTQEGTIDIQICQPGIEIHITSSNSKLSRLEQDVLKAYIDNVLNNEYHESTIEKIKTHYNPPNTAILNPDSTDVIISPYTQGIKNNVSLYHSVFNHLLENLPSPFSNKDITRLIYNFYKSHNKSLGRDSARQYGHFYKRVLLEQHLIEQIENRDGGTKEVFVLINNDVSKKDDMTLSKQESNDSPTCIESIRGILVNHPPGRYDKDFFIQRLPVYDEEEIMSAIRQMVANQEINQMGKDIFEFNPVVHDKKIMEVSNL